MTWASKYYQNRSWLGMPYLSYSGGSPASLIDPRTGSYISTSPPVYTFGSHPYPWDVKFGDEILIHPNCLTGYGANTQGIKLRSDGTNWRFADRGQLIYGTTGSVATPLVAGVVGSAAEFSLLGSLAQPMIPANMLYVGARGVVKCQIRKTNANSTFDVIIRLGSVPIATDIYSNDALINLASVANADKRDFWAVVEFVVTAAGGTGTAKAKVTNYLAPNGSATNAIVDRSSKITTIANMYLNINSKNASTSDTFSLLDYSLELLPQ